MGLKSLEAAVRLVASSGHAWPKLVLFGGEPLLAKRLVRRALELLRREARPDVAPEVHLVTNGLLLDDATADLLDEHRVTVELSCDGLAAAQERRGVGTAAILRTVLARLASRHPGLVATRLIARVTVDSANAATLCDSFETLTGAGVRTVQPSPVNTPDTGWNDRAAAVLDAKLARIRKRALRLDPEGGRWAFVPFRPAAPSGRLHASPACSVGSPDVLFVDVDGAVAPCGAFADSVHPSLPPLAEAVRGALRGARVGEGTSEDRLVRRRAAALRLPVLRAGPGRRSPRGPCASCEALPECFVCPASIAFAPEQDPNLVPAIQCDWNRLVAKHRRAFLARLASRGSDPQRAGSISNAAETSAVTPARIDGA
jgi:sulfatase maturation enzyme AslB (radical SAM superfamily)